MDVDVNLVLEVILVFGLFFFYSAVADVVVLDLVEITDVEMTAVSGLSFCYSSAVVLDLVSDATTDADANYKITKKRGWPLWASLFSSYVFIFFKQKLLGFPFLVQPFA